MQAESGRAEDAFQVVVQRLDDAAVLGKHQAAVSRGGDVFCQVAQTLHFAAFFRVVVVFSQVLGGVVADLLELAENG